MPLRYRLPGTGLQEGLCVADKGVYQRVGEATELALRVLTEKIGLPGYGSHALDSLSRVERATYCNDHWQQSYKKVNCNPYVLDRSCYCRYRSYRRHCSYRRCRRYCSYRSRRTYRSHCNAAEYLFAACGDLPLPPWGQPPSPHSLTSTCGTETSHKCIASVAVSGEAGIHNRQQACQEMCPLPSAIPLCDLCCLDTPLSSSRP